jgi:hypothetical protein
MEQHTVEVAFRGELVPTHADEVSTDRLYRTEDGTYYVHIDARKVGEDAVLEIGHYPHGLSEARARQLFPELFEALPRP